MGRFEMVGPSIGRELVRAKVEGLLAEAAREARARRPALAHRRPGGLRLSLGRRLVGAGYRLVGDTVEVR